MAEDNRKICDGFLKDFLKSDVLGAFLCKVKNDDDLELCFRGNDHAVNIYYNNQMVWKIHQKDRKGEYKVEVSLHKSYEKQSEIAEKLKDQFHFVLTTSNGNEQRYPYVKGKSFNSEFVDGTYALLKPMLDDYFLNDKHIEKKRQQELFRKLIKSKNDYYAYDLEAHQKGVKKEGQNLPDMFAIRFSGGKPKALVLVEVKSTKAACSDKKTGITKHIEGMENYINNNPELIKNRKNEAADIIEQYRTLNGLRNVPEVLIDPNDLKEEIIMIFTDDEAINYYINHKGNIEKKSCKMFKWENDDLKKL